jgi:pimeloyl-ACP methyl ester carboxylesterase
MRQLWSSSKEMIQIQSTTLDQAWDCLAQRIEMQRAYRTRRYDVYLPPPSEKVMKEQDQTRPILFLPGAGVAHTAYAEVAALLSDEGYLVAVVHSGPQRIVDRWMRPFRVRVLRNLQTTIQKRHNIPSSAWILAGHSMGALTCTVLADSLGITDIIMWAVPPFIEWQADLSNSPAKKNVLVVQGSKDWVVETFSTPETTEIFWNRLPMAQKHVIPNGTHSGFASYVPGWKPEVEGGLPREQHHQEVVQATVDFLKQQRSCTT